MRRLCLCILGGSLFCHSTLADIDPAAVDMGPFKFTPTLTVGHSHDSNIYNQPDLVQSSAITSLKPQMQLLGQKDLNRVAMTYSGDWAKYHSSHEDNYEDHSLSLDGYFEMDSRNRFDLSASTQRLHDNRGTGSSEGSAALSRDEPDEYRQDTLFGEWDFGADGARFGARVTASTVDIEYRNNRIETQFRDRDEAAIAGRLYGRIAGKTRFFFEFEQSNIEYDTIPLSGNALDSDQQAVSLGVEWDITGRTSGSVKFGRTEKDFDSAALVDADINSWKAQVSYALKSYSNLFFTSSRTPRETNGTGNFIDSRSHSLSWKHDWGGYFNSTVSYGLGTDEYDGSVRSDDLTDYSVAVGYDLDRWINLSLKYSYQDKDSNVDTFDYDKRVLALSVNMSL